MRDWTCICGACVRLATDEREQAVSATEPAAGPPEPPDLQRLAVAQALADAKGVIARQAAEITRINRITQVIMATSDANLDAKDATIDRLWAQLCDGQLVEEAACRERHPAGKSLPPTEITHATPTWSGGICPCCYKTPFELPRMDRMTLDPLLVTCVQDAFDRRAQ